MERYWSIPLTSSKSEQGDGLNHRLHVAGAFLGRRQAFVKLISLCRYETPF